jgi:hypothetical protein
LPEAFGAFVCFGSGAAFALAGAALAGTFLTAAALAFFTSLAALYN